MIQVRIYRAVNGRSTNRVFWRQGAFRELPRIGETVVLTNFGCIPVADVAHNPDHNSLDIYLKADNSPQRERPNLNIDETTFQFYRDQGWHQDEI